MEETEAMFLKGVLMDVRDNTSTRAQGQGETNALKTINIAVNCMFHVLWL